MEDFQQTVDLKTQAEREREAMRKKIEPHTSPRLRRASKSTPKSDKKKAEKASTKASAIDQVYNDKEERETADNSEFKRIDRPEIRPNYENLYKRVVAVLAVIIVSLVSYWFFWGQNTGEVAPETASGPEWYLVKLVTGEAYYGQIDNISADPVVIKNVYYNYDQLNPDNNQEESEGSNLRLVKRGKETHGPEGTMNIVRAQVVYMEPLKEESKVLKAILDYEK